jgi:site-specific DNA-methyltransferase (adenine-specific)
MEINKLLLADCFDALPEISDESVDMVLSDPPYGTLHLKWDNRKLNIDALWSELNRVIKPNGAIVLTAIMRFAVKLINSNYRNFRYDLVWEKSMPVGHPNSNRAPLRNHELILAFSKKLTAYNPQGLIKLEKPRKHRDKNREGNIYRGTAYNEHLQYYSNYPRSVLKFSNSIRDRIHPAQKPVDLFEYLIKTYTNPGELVLDPFAGSGTTAVAALNTGRRFLCFENDREIYERAIERLKKKLAEKD